MWAVASIPLLAACAALDQPKLVGELKIDTLDVPVKIVVPCVTDIPKAPQSAMPAADAGLARKAAGAVADALAYRAHADELEAALRECANGGKP